MSDKTETLAHPADDVVDRHLDAVLRASGSALRHYSMQKTLDDMRTAMRGAMVAPNGLLPASRHGAKACSEAFEWLRREATKEGALSHAGVVLDEWHALATAVASTSSAGDLV